MDEIINMEYFDPSHCMSYDDYTDMQQRQKKEDSGHRDDDVNDGRIIYVKKYDVETDRCYYENTKTGETSDVKPINLRSEDLDEPDTGTPWHCAFCENINKGLQLNCRVCKRDKESSLKRKQLEEEE